VSMFTPRGEGARPLRQRRGRGGGRRVAAVIVTGLLLVTLAVLAWQSTRGDDDPDVRAGPEPTCPTPATLPPALAPAKVRVNVYNATDRRGLAAKVAGQLERRGFDVRKVDNDPLGRTVTGAAEVRHGDDGAAAARTVAAQVGPVVSVPDGRRGGSVDLVVGTGFTALVAPAGAAAVLSPSPSPTPAGC
jgi:hypothetical protein